MQAAGGIKRIAGGIVVNYVNSIASWSTIQDFVRNLKLITQDLPVDPYARIERQDRNLPCGVIGQLRTTRFDVGYNLRRIARIMRHSPNDVNSFRNKMSIGRAMIAPCIF